MGSILTVRRTNHLVTILACLSWCPSFTKWGSLNCCNRMSVKSLFYTISVLVIYFDSSNIVACSVIQPGHQHRAVREIYSRSHRRSYFQPRYQNSKFNKYRPNNRLGLFPYMENQKNSRYPVFSTTRYITTWSEPTTGFILSFDQQLKK